MLSDAELISKHSKTESSGCWIWSRSINNWGYGRIGPGRSERAAHRLSYRTFRGEIPDGMNVLHRCDVPRCVNPAHLFLGTNTDNMRDMASKGRTAVKRGEDNPISKLTDRAVAEIRASTETSAFLARKFGVSHKAIRLVRGGVTWSR